MRCKTSWTRRWTPRPRTGNIEQRRPQREGVGETSAGNRRGRLNGDRGECRAGNIQQYFRPRAC